MAETKKERYRRIRGAILKLLGHQHPGPLSLKEIHFLLDDLGYTIREEELRSHISYLEEKKYLKVDQRESGGIKLEMLLATGDGLNVLDRFTKDVGVNVEF